MPKRNKAEPVRIEPEFLADPNNIIDCRACPLGGKGVPPDSRMPYADILVIAEAPGADEVKARIPLVGQSGKLARSLFLKGGIAQRIHIINTVNCRPPGNRDPEDIELETCAQWVQAYIERMKPQAIITLGKFSSKAYAGRKGSVGSYNGKVTKNEGVYYLSLYHPAYLMRARGTPKYRELEESYLASFSELVHNVDTKADVPDYEAQVVQWVVPPAGAAFDIEAVGKDPRTATPLLASAATRDGVWVFPLTNPLDWTGWPTDEPLTVHNSQYELVMLRRMGMPKVTLCEDTMVAAHMVGERNVALKDVTRRNLGVLTMDYSQMMESVGWGPKVNYSAQDSAITRDLLPILKGRMSPATRTIYDDIERYLAPILAESTFRGLEIDRARLAPLLAEAHFKLSRVKESIHALEPDLNPNSWQQKQDTVKRRSGVTIKETNRATMSKLYERTGDPLYRLLIAHSILNKSTGTYLDKFDSMERFSCRWNMTGTETGRLSSEDPNGQNIPHRLAVCIRARDGMVFITGDYSGLELRIGAVASLDPRMIENFLTGRDPHSDLAELIYGKGFSKEQRVRAKSANFEIQYLGGPAKLAEMLGIPLHEARKLHSGHRTLYPQFHRWAERTIEESFARGYTETLEGRQRFLWDISSSDPYLVEKAQKQAVNTPIQGTGGDITKRAMVFLDPPMNGLDGWVPLQVHDSVTIEVPAYRAKEGKHMLKELMIAAVPQWMRDIIPFEVDIKEPSEWWG